MAGKIIEISCASDYLDKIKTVADEQSARILSYSPSAPDDRGSIRVFVEIDRVQSTLDSFQAKLPTSSEALIVLSPVDAKIGGDDNLLESASDVAIATREELFSKIKKGVELDTNFILLSFLATVVAAIGISDNNVAVVIGAMVIAPLLGPNIGLALGSVLGDKELIRAAIITNGLGLSITVFVAAAIAFIWPPNMESNELISRVEVRPSAIVLALASGVAAVISLTSRLPNALVGVMVAVALVPPATVMGMMAAVGNWPFFKGAGLMLIINIVAVNFSSQLVFLIRGVRPRTWLAKRKAKQSVKINIAVWGVLMVLTLVAAILV